MFWKKQKLGSCPKCKATASLRLGPMGDHGWCEACEWFGPVNRASTDGITRREAWNKAGHVVGVASFAIGLKQCLEKPRPAPHVVEAQTRMMGTGSGSARATVVPLEVSVADANNMSDDIQTWQS